MSEEIEIDDIDIHDFRPQNLIWGWSGFDFKIIDPTFGEQKAVMSGVSGNVRIKQGQYIYMTHGEQEIVWRIDIIQYQTNPKDMFHVHLSYAGVPDK